jgi:RNA polymerase sigma-70 factor (ECF subfamily)
MNNLQTEITKHSEHLKYYALSLTNDNDDASDLMQETLYKALKNQHRYVKDKNLRSWLFTIMKNTFINQYRREKYRQKMVAEVKDVRTYASAKVENEVGLDLYVMRSDIHKALMKLNPKYRVPFILFYKGFKYTEIAKRLDLPLGTIKSRIYFARKLLMEDLEGLL